MSNIYEEVRNEPLAEQVIQKKVAVGDDGFEDRKFIRMHNPIPTRGSFETELEEWCRTTLGPPRYLGQWFAVGNYIILDEQSYFLWKLTR